MTQFGLALALGRLPAEQEAASSILAGRTISPPIWWRGPAAAVLQSRAIRKAISLLAALLWLSACGGFCGSSSSTASAPIVGYWTFKGGVVQIATSGSGYDGTITTKPTDGPCAEPVGSVLLKLNSSGNHYTGAEEWWDSNGCVRMYSNTATIDVTGATAHLCSNDPFPGGGEQECVDMQRRSGP